MNVILSTPVAFSMLLISMIGWGSWTNTFKKCKGWRFEAFYWDYTWSIIAWTLILSLLCNGFHIQKWTTIGIFWAAFGGFVWGIGNILLVAAIELAGVATAFPLSVGLGLVIGTFLSYITNPQATKNPQFLFFGLFIVALAIISNGLAYKLKEKANTKKNNFKKGIAISLISGIFIALWSFPFNYAFKSGLNGYAGAFFMTIGGLLATIILLPVLMKKPLIKNQSSIGFSEYTRAKIAWHLWAILGGIIWATATIFNLVVASLPNFSVAIAYTLGNCAPMVAAIWGIFIWKEFKHAPKKSHFYLGLMFTLFIVGIIILSKATN